MSKVSKLNDYGVDPFERVAKELSTGKEIYIEIITDMINADVVIQLKDAIKKLV